MIYYNHKHISIKLWEILLNQYKFIKLFMKKDLIFVIIN